MEIKSLIGIVMVVLFVSPVWAAKSPKNQKLSKQELLNDAKAHCYATPETPKTKKLLTDGKPQSSNSPFLKN